MILDAQVSIFGGSYDTTVQETVALGTVLARIEGGTYRPYVEQLRHLLTTRGEKAYKTAKEKSVAFTPCCALTTRDKAIPWGQKLTACTGLVHLDVDGMDDPEGLKAQLAQHPATVFAFVSPRGTGLKIGMATTGIESPESYKHAWGVVVEFIRLAYPAVRVNIDEHVKYLHALCYMSYDAAPYINQAATPLRIPPAPKPAPARPRPPDDRTDYERVREALAYIPTYDAYDPWLEIGMALHSTGQSWARAAWDDWSCQSDKFDAGEQSKSWHSFHEDGKTTIATLFHRAKEGGWQPPREPQRSNGHRPGIDMTQATAEAQAHTNGTATLPLAASNVSSDDLLTLSVPKKDPYLDWLTERAIAMVYGPRGVGKTYFLLELALCLAMPRPFLKWPVQQQVGVLFVDGEMALDSLQTRLRQLAGDHPPSQLRFLPSELVYARSDRDLTLTGPQDRLSIDAMLEEHNTKVLILDNISCLFPGLDESKKSDWEPINAWLIRLRHRGITAIVGHHAGKNGQQRGTSGREDHIDLVLALSLPPGHQAEDGCHVHLRFEKTRGVKGSTVEALDVRLEDSPHGHVWTYAPLDARRKERIKDMLEDGMPPKLIADELGLSPSYVYRCKREFGF
jgi:hypothetical protein